MWSFNLLEREVIRLSKKLTKQQKAFCTEYIKNGLNGSQAYLVAYAKTVKSEVTARTNAYKLLQKAHVQKHIEQLQSEIEANAIMGIEDRQKWLTDVFTGQILETVTDKEGNVYEIAPKMSDRLKALDILNKMNGAYTNNVNVSTNGEISIKIVPDQDD